MATPSFYNAFSAMTLSYKDAGYRLVPTGGPIRTLLSVASELFKRRMPLGRVMNLLRCDGRCTDVTVGVPLDRPAKPYDACVLSQLIFEPKQDASFETILKGVDEAFKRFNNESVCRTPPVLLIKSGSGMVELPAAPEQRAMIIARMGQNAPK